MIASTNRRSTIRRAVSSIIETLENRQLFTVTLSSGILTADGSSGNDTISIWKVGSNIRASVNGSSDSFAAASVNSIVANGLAGNDKISIDINVVASGSSSTINGGADADEVFVIGTDASQDTATFTSSGFTITNATITTTASFTVSNTESREFAGRGGSDNLVVNSGPTVYLTETQKLNSLTIGSGARLELKGGSHMLLTVPSVANLNGLLSIEDNDVIVDYTSSASPVNAVVSKIMSGLTLLGGSGTSGIGSSIVDNQSMSSSLIGYIDDGDPIIGGAVTSLSGYPIPNPNSSVLVKFTWMGDNNLDGTVDGADAALLDSGFTSGGSLGGWVFGDYDYNGVVDGSDPAIYDSGFVQQTQMLGDNPATPASLTATSSTSSAAVNLSWSDIATNETGNVIERAIDPGFTTSLTTIALTTANQTSYVDSTITGGIRYYYRIKATNTIGTSGVSNVVSAVPVAPATLQAAPFVGGDPDANAPGGVAFGADGGSPLDASFSGGAVRYSDGREFFISTDVDPTEAGVISGMTRTWSSDPERSVNSNLGYGWTSSQWPILSVTGSVVKIIEGGKSTRYYDKVGSVYNPRLYGQDKLEEPTTGNFKLTDTLGNVMYFNNTGWPTQYIDAGGNTTTYTYTSGKLSSITRKLGNTSTVLEQIEYTYYSGGQLSDVTIKRQDSQNTTTPATIRKIHYDYSDNTSAQSLLSVVTISRADNIIVDKKHYRYDANNRLLIVLEEGSYERAAANVSGGNPTSNSVSNATLEPFADLVFTWDGNGKLASQTIKGQGKYDYTYSTNAGYISGINNWKYKTIESLPDTTPTITTDDDYVTVYSNSVGEVLASVFVDQDAAGNKQWVTAYQYDADGRLLNTINPSAITGAVNESLADIVTPIVSTTAGLIGFNTYYPSTDVQAGYLKIDGVKQGLAGTQIKQAEYAYGTKLPNSQGRLLTSETVYRNETGTGITTTHVYPLANFTGDQYGRRETTLPAVSAAQNGDNTTPVEIRLYDTFGRITQFIDGDNKTQTTSYVNALGTISQQTIDSTGTPLTTNFESDGLGRNTKITDPLTHITMTSYLDTETLREVTVLPPAVVGTGDLSSFSTVPAQITQVDRSHGIVDSIRVTRDSSGGIGSSITALSRTITNNSDQVLATERYSVTAGITFTSGTALGTSIGGTRYRTEYAYDARGRQIKVAAGRDNYSGSMPGTNPTITRTEYDALDRVVSTWIGTDDSGYSSPSSPGINMVKVTSQEYDNNTIGDSNLTKSTQYVDTSSSNDRVVTHYYDWRNRLVASKSGVGTSEATDVNRPISYVKYDNLDRAVANYVFDGDGVTPSATTMPSASLMRSASVTQYDDRGRTFRTSVFSVDQTNGINTGDSSVAGIYNNSAAQFAVSTDSNIAGMKGLRTNHWYNNRDQVVKTQNPGGLVDKYVYDGAGRQTLHASTDGGTVNAIADDPNSLTGNIVLEQVETTYDLAGNVIFTTTRQRNHDETLSGSLGDSGSTTLAKARASFMGYYYDNADRLITTINWGNYGGTVLTTRPGSAPGRAGTDGWDPLLRTDQSYDEAGRLRDSNDPKNIVARSEYDALDRNTISWENFVGNSGAVDSRKTRREYDGFNHVKQVETTSYNPSARTFVNDYHYGITKGTDYLINSSGILHDVVYGRPAGAAASSTGQHVEIYTGYNIVGENTKKQDSLATVSGTTVTPSYTLRQHSYEYDVRGMQIRDSWDTSVPTPATMTDLGRVREFKYDTLGRGTLFTVKGSVGGAADNEVKRDYDGLGHLIREWQEHQGAVNGSTLSTQYLYDTNSGSSSAAFTANRSRQIGLQYPNGHTVSYQYGFTNYNNAGSPIALLNDAISRVGFIQDGTDTGTTGNNAVLEFYQYLGLETLVDRQAPRVSKGTSFITLTTSVIYDLDPGSGNIFTTFNFIDDAGTNDPYGGLDRFGRTVLYVSGPDLRAYAYDANSNLLSSWDSRPNDYRSELYQYPSDTAANAYDGLNRIQHYQRGKFTTSGMTLGRPKAMTFGSNGIPQQSASWSYNSDGNYQRNTDSLTEPDARGVYQRPIPTTGSGTTTTDIPDGRQDLFAQYDGWGQLAVRRVATLQKTDVDPGNTWSYTYASPAHVISFRYDALGRRIIENDSDGSVTYNTDNNHLFYDGDRVIEERNENSGAIDAIADDHLVYSVGDPGKIVLWDENNTGTNSGPYGGGLDTREWITGGLDGSTWMSRLDGSNAAGDVEQYNYTTEGVASVATRITNVSSSWINNGENPVSKFRYLWKGGRSDGDGLLMMPDGSEHDTHRGTPMGEDAFAYPNYVQGNFFESANNNWTHVQEREAYAGTQGTWSVPGTWGVWTDFSGKYDQYMPSEDWHNDVGFGESFIPVWGSGKQAANDYWYAQRDWDRGDYLGAFLNHTTGDANVVNAISDIFMVKSAGKSLVKGGSKLLATGAGRWALEHPKTIAAGIATAAMLANANEAEAGKLKIIQEAAEVLLKTERVAPTVLELSKASGSRGRSYITYVLKNARDEIKYIGRASGKGLPEEILKARLSKGHDIFKLGGLFEEIHSVHSTRGAMRGAEEYYMKQLKRQGSKLLNSIAAIDFNRVDRAEKGLKYLRQFIKE